MSCSKVIVILESVIVMFVETVYKYTDQLGGRPWPIGKGASYGKVYFGGSSNY